MNEKPLWTDADLADVEQTAYKRGYAEAFKQLEHQLQVWVRPNALNFTREVRRLMAIANETMPGNIQGYDQGVLAERMRIKRITLRHLLPSGKLIWHQGKDMTYDDYQQLIDDGQG